MSRVCRPVPTSTARGTVSAALPRHPRRVGGPAGHRGRPLPQQSSRPAASKRNDGHEDDPEASKVQDALVDILNLQIGYKKVQDMVSEESAKLEETAAQLKEEIERTQAEQREQQDASFLEAMEELDQISRKAEEDLRGKSVFNELQSNDEDFAAWEAQMEQERSAGQFFKQLYVDKDRKRPTTTSMTREEMKAKADEIRTEMDKELRNPFRMVTYTFLATVLVGSCIQDVTTESPKWGLVALYMAIACFLAINAAQEIRYLNRQEHDDGK